MTKSFLSALMCILTVSAQAGAHRWISARRGVFSRITSAMRNCFSRFSSSPSGNRLLAVGTLGVIVAHPSASEVVDAAEKMEVAPTKPKPSLTMVTMQEREEYLDRTFIPNSRDADYFYRHFSGIYDDGGWVHCRALVHRHKPDEAPVNLVCHNTLLKHSINAAQSMGKRSEFFDDASAARALKEMKSFLKHNLTYSFNTDYAFICGSGPATIAFKQQAQKAPSKPSCNACGVHQIHEQHMTHTCAKPATKK